jgi:hypothetical protein
LAEFPHPTPRKVHDAPAGEAALAVDKRAIHIRRAGFIVCPGENCLMRRNFSCSLRRGGIMRPTRPKWRVWVVLRGDCITMLAPHQRRFKKAARGDAQPDSDYDIAVFSTSSR